MTEDVKDEELKVNEQQDGSVTIGDEPPPQEEDSQEDARVVDHQEDEDHDEESDEGLSPEEKRERNRQRRAESKQRKKEYIDSLKRELSARDRIINEMNQRLSTVERKSTGSEMAQLDNAEREAVQAYNYFKNINAKAIEQANGQVANDAQEKMFQARQRAEQIRHIRNAYQNRQTAPQPLDPRLVNHAQGWMNENRWYDPQGRDEDSAIALTIDNRMAQEGWDPTTPEYWKELASRVKRYLPHRAKAGYNKGNVGNRAAPPVAGSGRETTSSKGTYKLSAERVTALKEAGLWENPKQRAEAIKRFQQYDKEQQA